MRVRRPRPGSPPHEIPDTDVADRGRLPAARRRLARLPECPGQGTRTGSEASDRAASIASASSSADSKKRELERCRSSDTKRDSCRTLSDEYDGAQQKLQSAKGALDSALDDVDASVRSANRACEYPASSSTPGATSSSSDPICW